MKVQLRASAAVAAFFVSSVAAFSQVSSCQGQNCHWNSTIRCYQCLAAEGFACAVNIDNCKTCTNSFCGGGGLSPVQRTGGTSAGTSSCAAYKSPGTMAETAMKTKPGSTMISFFVPEGSPATFTKATFGGDNIFQGAELQNVSDKRIVGYRVGWLMISKKQLPVVELSMQINESLGIAPGEKHQVPAQKTDRAHFGNDLGDIEFFVASVLFEDGSTWNVDTEKLKSEVQQELAALKAK